MTQTLDGFVVGYLDGTKLVILGWFPNEPDAEAWNANMRVLGVFVVPMRAVFTQEETKD